MKLPITDKFLWDIYSYLEKGESIVNFILSSRHKQAIIIAGIRNPIIRKYQREMGKRKFAKFIHYLKRKNYIKAKNLKNNKGFIVTKNGLSKALKASFKADEGRKRKDGKWIMLAFDIPQTHRKARNLLKSILVNLKYKMFQQSIWVTPYDVSEKTEDLLQLYSLDRYVKIFLIEEM